MTATFHVGDAIEVMGKLPEKSVDLVLTSPPFLALRSYLPADHPDKALEGGSQATPGEYIDWLIDVVEACDRVLAPHGSLCVELGDTYAGSGGAGGDYGADGLREGQPSFGGSGRRGAPSVSPDGQTGHYTGRQLRPFGPNAGSGWPLAKSLSLIPELFRLTLVYGHNPLTGRQTDRWRLRNVVRWVRPNPPVGALGDKFRPATSELMMFCKSAKRYFDLDAVRSEWKPRDDMGTPRAYHSAVDGGYDKTERLLADTNGGAPPLDWWNIPPGGYEGSHYAVWPPELLIKPVKAMCPQRVCRVCGEPSRRITEIDKDGIPSRLITAHTETRGASRVEGTVSPQGRIQAPLERAGIRTHTSASVTLGFSDCGHDDYRNGLILDPFGGSGTTALVASGHGRDCILIDLDERNYDLALQRVGPLILSLAEVV